MPRNMRSFENVRRAKGLRDRALERNELRGATEPRTSPAGVTSMPIKINPDADLIERFLADRKGGK